MADINSLLDSLFMTRKTPVQGLLSPEEQQSLETQKNIGTALGILTGVGTNYNKGVLSSVLGGVTGAVGGRQAPIDYATKNFMTTTELAKMMQDMKKTSLETNFLQQKQDALVNLIKGTNDPVLKDLYKANLDGVTAQMAKRNYPAPDFGESLAIKAIGGDINNLTSDQALSLIQSKGGLTQKDILEANIKGAETPALATAFKNIPMQTPADILRSGRIPQNVSSGQGVSYTPPTEIRLPSTNLFDRTEPVIYNNQGGVPLTQPSVSQQTQQLHQQKNLHCNKKKFIAIFKLQTINLQIKILLLVKTCNIVLKKCKNIKISFLKYLILTLGYCKNITMQNCKLINY